jgi:hypothetical protein
MMYSGGESYGMNFTCDEGDDQFQINNNTITMSNNQPISCPIITLGISFSSCTTIAMKNSIFDSK